MPGRALAAKELATLLNALAHPVRVRIVEELHGRPMDVNTLQSITAVSSSNVSQHLAILRTHRIVQERREGRRVIYSLAQPAIAAWYSRWAVAVSPRCSAARPSA